MSKINTFLKLLKTDGIKSVWSVIFKKITKKNIKNYHSISTIVKGKYGIEIGGPSWIFRDYSVIPIYKLIKQLDSCNFASNTIWENSLIEGHTFNFYKNKIGYQYIREATDLTKIPDENYDFLLSSNCLEHIANPIKALYEWIRVVKSNGYLLIVVPNKDEGFDHKRNITSFDHLLSDFKNNTQEDDFTHLEEILALHDLNFDLKAGTFEQFKDRSLQNHTNRTLHHHVFDVPLLKEIFHFLKLEVVFTEIAEKNNIILGRKTVAN